MACHFRIGLATGEARPIALAFLTWRQIYQGHEHEVSVPITSYINNHGIQNWRDPIRLTLKIRRVIADYKLGDKLGPFLIVIGISRKD